MLQNTQIKQRDNTNAIIILGYPSRKAEELSSILHTRLDLGIKLYKEYSNAKVIVSGAAVHNSLVEAEIMAAYCVRNGVDSDDIFLEKKARNTYENALYTTRLMRSLNIKKATIVTSIFHKKRSKYLFQRHLTDFEIKAANFPSDFPWYKKLLFTLREQLVMLWYIFIGDEWLYKHTTKQLKQRRTQLQ